MMFRTQKKNTNNFLNKKSVLGNNKGVITEALIGFTILSLGTLGVVKYMQPVQKVSQAMVETQQISNLRNATLHILKDLLVDVQDQSDPDKKHTNGLCSFVNPPVRSYGVERISLSFAGLVANTSFNDASWKAKFTESEWEFASVSERDFCEKIAATSGGNFTDGPFEKCLKYRSSEQPTSVLYVVAKILPVKFKLVRGKIETQALTLLSSQTDVSANSMAFKIQMQISGFKIKGVENAENKVAYKLEDLVFPSDATYCDVKQKNSSPVKYVDVWFSGIGPINLGPALYDQTVSQADITPADVCSGTAIEIQQLQRSYLPGISSDNTGAFLVGKDISGLSCTREKFLCPGTSNAPTHFGDMDFVFKVRNNTQDSIPIKKLKFTLGRKSGTNINELDGSTKPGELDGASVSFYYSTDLNREIGGNTALSPTFRLPPGNGYFRVVISGASNRCVHICDKYKTQGPVYPIVQMEIVNNRGSDCSVGSDWHDVVANRVECQYCQMKACHNATVKAYAGYNEFTGYEPLDSYLPECGTKVPDYRILPALKPYDFGGGPTRATDFESECWGISLLARPASSGDPKDRSLDNISSFYRPLSCSELRPVICYVNGGYRVAMNFVGNQRKVVKANFQDAQKICHEMGREQGSREDLKKMLEVHYPLAGTAVQTYVSGLPDSSDTNNYNFINLGGSGIFLAPLHGLRGIFVSSLSSWMSSTNNTNEELDNYKILALMLNEGYTFDSAERSRIFSTYFNGSDISEFLELWLGMSYDGGGYIVGSPPWAMVSGSGPSNRLMYFNKGVDIKEGAKLTVVKDSRSLLSGTGRYVSVVHNVRWRGIQLESDASQSLKFVCRRNVAGVVDNLLDSEGNDKDIYSSSEYFSLLGDASFLSFLDEVSRFYVPQAEAGGGGGAGGSPGAQGSAPIPMGTGGGTGGGSQLVCNPVVIRCDEPAPPTQPDDPPLPPDPPLLLTSSGSATLASLQVRKMYFVTDATGTFSEGPAKCKAEGGIFVPPVSGLDWAKVMLELNNYLDDHAFPDMGLSALSLSEVEHVQDITEQKAWVALEHKEDSVSQSAAYTTNQLRFSRTLWNDSRSVFVESQRSDILDILGNNTNGFMLNPDPENCTDQRTPKRLSYALMYTNGVPIPTPNDAKKPPWAYYPHWDEWDDWGSWSCTTAQHFPTTNRQSFYVQGKSFINKRFPYQLTFDFVKLFYIPSAEAGGGGGGVSAPGAIPVGGNVIPETPSTPPPPETEIPNEPTEGAYKFPNYRRVCVREINQGDGQFVPVSTVQSHETCGPGEVVLNLCQNPGAFQPSSYVFMSYWYENVYLPNPSSELILAVPVKTAQASPDAPEWCKFVTAENLKPPPPCPDSRPPHGCEGDGCNTICEIYDPTFSWSEELSGRSCTECSEWMNKCDNKQCNPVDCTTNPQYPRCCPENPNHPSCRKAKCDPVCAARCRDESWKERGNKSRGYHKDWFSKGRLANCLRNTCGCDDCADCVRTCPGGEDSNGDRIHSRRGWWYKGGYNPNYECTSHEDPNVDTEHCEGLECLRFRCSPLCSGVFDIVPESPVSPPGFNRNSRFRN